MKAVCDRCGFERKWSALRREWTGLMVCSDCLDPRHPQEFVRAVHDSQGVRPNLRPPPADVFIEVAPVPPQGLQFLQSADGVYLKGADGAYLCRKAA